jgi:hypothetical protein
MTRNPCRVKDYMVRGAGEGAGAEGYSQRPSVSWLVDEAMRSTSTR